MVLIFGTCSTYMWYICLVHVALTCVTFSTYQTVFTHVVWHLLLTAGINEGIVLHSIRFGCVAFNAIDWFSTYHRHKGIKRQWGPWLLHQVYLILYTNILHIQQTNLSYLLSKVHSLQNTDDKYLADFHPLKPDLQILHNIHVKSMWKKFM